jgi:ferredoxin
VQDYARCVGCGLCATLCPVDARQLERRPEGEAPLLPADELEWMTQRAEARGISLLSVL